MKYSRLEQWADREVRTLRRKLSPEIARHADGIPVVCFPAPTREMVEDEGVEPDLLGLFVGPAMDEAEGLDDPLPPEILLFLENLWDYAEEDPEIYREEVRRTYLHELGHYLGLEEDDMAPRDLD
jgi:predicted Zn-dependent protease with MMP-like domain